MAGELTDAEVERIDFLHNETHEYLTRILCGHYTEWDIDLIGRVADAVWDAIRDKGWMDEREFYPFREDAGYDDDPSIDCCDFCWADLALAEDYSKCCEMCYNFDEQTKKCKLD